MRAIITGAARGIGRPIALRLARDGQQRGGARLVLANLDGDELQSLAAEVAALGALALPCPCDLADPDSATLLARTAAAFGGLDAVVSNAGVALRGPLVDYSVEHWDRTFAVHVRAPGCWPAPATPN